MKNVYICLNCKEFHISKNNNYTCNRCGGKTHHETADSNRYYADNFEEQNEPLPCPFCAEKEIEVVRNGSYKASRIVRCTNCGCELETNEINSWNQWNTREWTGAL